MLPLSAARLALAPVLLVQGRRVRRVALKLPEADGPRAGVSRAPGAVGDAPALRLLILGDSSAAGVGAGLQDQALSGRLLAALHARGVPRIAWRLEARTGWAAADALAHVSRLPAEDADLVLCVLGVNDVTADQPVQRWLRTLGALDARLHAQAPSARVAWSGLPPMHRFPLLPQPLRWYLGERARRFDAALARWCGQAPHRLHLAMVDIERGSPGAGLMAEDGFHPGPAGCRLWADGLADALVGAGVGARGAEAAPGSPLFRSECPP